jgi:hypothetical protein
MEIKARRRRIVGRVTLAALAAVFLVGLGACATTGEPIPWEECLPSFMSGIPLARITTAEYGARDVVLVDSEESKDEVFGLVVTDNRVPALALRINFFSDGEIFKIESAVDGSCRPIRRWENAYRPGETDLQNWDAVLIKAGGSEYEIRLGYHGSGRVEAELVPSE